MKIAPSLTIEHKPKWTIKHYQLLVFNMLIKFGDAVEIYLLGVITQKVAYELNLSKIQKGFLGVTMYITIAIAILIRLSNYWSFSTLF